jgi:hypothetical protein
MLTAALRRRGPRFPGLALLLILAAAMLACSSSPPPTPAAAAFRQEILQTLQRLQPPLAAALSRRDIPALDAILQQTSKTIPGLWFPVSGFWFLEKKPFFSGAGLRARPSQPQATTFIFMVRG